MIKFIKDDEESYEVRVTNSDSSDWELAGKLVKDDDGMWSFEYGDQSVEYEDSLRETEVDLEEEFENGKAFYVSHYFGDYTYKQDK